MFLLFGGFVGVVFLIVFIFVVCLVVLLFKLFEFLMILIFGLLMVGIFVGCVVIKGIVVVGLGMLIGIIGEGLFNGELCMLSYDFFYLMDGLKLVIVGLGIFVVLEIVVFLCKDCVILEMFVLGGGWLEGIKDWWVNKWFLMCCFIIGVIVGVISGFGGFVVDWIVYGYVV